MDTYRLPRQVVPSRYVLKLTPDLSAFTFAGEAQIDITATEQVAQIVLNAADLEITSGNVGGTPVADICYDAQHERAVLTLSEPLAAGDACLNLSFRGTLNDQLRGFYRSTFTDAEHTERTIATTQFESTNARRAFPCWDEPDLKAVFEVTLVVPEDLMAVSSGAQTAAKAIGNGLKEVSFAPTIKMSTYLLAFVVGPLEATDPVDVNGTPLRVIHPLGKGHLTEFALDAAAGSLAFFEDYFDIAYPGDKLDLVAIPDFAFGAMENMGCVTFREVLLLVNPATSTQQERQTAADVIAHELAHMWFGNLVTMKWWNGIWLKEAFATFCEMLAVDAYRPDWNRWLAFGLSRTAAFEVDALSATRAVEFPVVSPADAEAMYDLLTYEKGAAIVRMLEQYLGADQFRDAVRMYLRQHSYNNTETHHLWDALATASGQPIREVMDSWIFQGGHPLVSATQATNSQAPHNKITLRQQRFNFSHAPANQTTEPYQTAETHENNAQGHWQVPVVVAAANNHQERLLLDTPATLNVDPNKWVMVNPNADGFYRVAYQDHLLQRLLNHSPQLNAQQRYVLTDDQWALTVANQLSVADYLAFAAQLAKTEDDLAVWRRLAGTMATLDHLVDSNGQQALRQQVQEMTQPALAGVGWQRATGEDERVSELRGVLIRSLAAVGNNSSAIARCRELFQAGCRCPATHAAAVAVIATTGGPADYENMLRHRAEASTPQLELRYLTALTLFTHRDLMSRTLTATLDGSIRSQDAGSVIRGCLDNRLLGPQAWAFVTQRWEEINQKIPSQAIPRMLAGICSLSTPELSQDVAAFLQANPIEQGPLIVAQHLERLQVNVALRQRVQATLN
ncbi:MAG: M1 family metallopeptidase [bacterium]|nr:M1 family metallopeptidase [bacterium]